MFCWMSVTFSGAGRRGVVGRCPTVSHSTGDRREKGRSSWALNSEADAGSGSLLVLVLNMDGRRAAAERRGLRKNRALPRLRCRAW